MLFIFGIHVSHAGTILLIRALNADGPPDASSARDKIRNGARTGVAVELSADERAAVLACVEDMEPPREGLVELRAVLRSRFIASLELAQRLACPECYPHTLWSHHSRGCTIEGCPCKHPQPANVAERKAEYLRDQQAAIEALRRRPKPVPTEPRVTVSYEGKFCAGCGIRFTKGDVGWHYVEDESGKVIRFCADCWKELLREQGE